MRACVFFICGFFLAGCKSNLEEKGHTISIPFTIVDGYGGFIPSFGWLSPKDEKSGWAKTYESPKGDVYKRQFGGFAQPKITRLKQLKTVFFVKNR